MREKGNGNKKSHGAEHVELFIMVGDNRIELVPQRTSFEGAKRRTNDRERVCRRLYDCREKKGNGNKKSHGAEHVELFIMVGDNRIELVPQRTHFEGAKRRTKCSESRMQEVI